MQSHHDVMQEHKIRRIQNFVDRTVQYSIIQYCIRYPGGNVYSNVARTVYDEYVGFVLHTV